MVKTHPTHEQLAAYASGSISDGMSLLIASHLTYCPSCRDEVAGFEMLGGAALADEDTNGIGMPDLDAVLAEVDGVVSDTEIEQEPSSPLPAPIRFETGTPFDALRWKFRMPGLHEHVLDGFDGEHVSLLRVRPGVGIFGHTHEGEEATLILQGEMEDDGIIYRRGDVALAGNDDDHHPRVVGDEVCYCLIVLSGQMRFTGPVARALNLFSR